MVWIQTVNVLNDLTQWPGGCFGWSRCSTGTDYPSSSCASLCIIASNNSLMRIHLINEEDSWIKADQAKTGRDLGL